MWLNKLAGRIRPEYSVPNQSTPPQCISPFLNLCRKERVHTIVDVGAGKLRSTFPLLRQGLDVWIVDTKFQLLRCSKLIAQARTKYKNLRGVLSLEAFSRANLRLDGATMISVLHTIPKLETRSELLRAVKRNVKPGGLVLIDVPFGEPYYTRRMNPRRHIFDGYVMGAGRIRTFYKLFKEKELHTLVERIGFKLIGNLGIRRHHSMIFTVDI